MTKKRFTEIIDSGQSYYCRPKCINSFLPFTDITDKEFIKSSDLVIKYPCVKCSGECLKNTNCIRCDECLKWSHLKCTKLTRKQFENTDAYLCSQKCEVKTLPFNRLKDDEIDDIHDHKYNFRHNHKSVEKSSKKNKGLPQLNDGSNNLTETNEVYCEYINSNNVKDVLDVHDFNSLSLFHCNVASLKKNVNCIEELFRDCNILPNIIAVTETKLMINSPTVELQGYKELEDCRITTHAGGAGVYILEGMKHTVREDISIRIDRCEEKWIEVNTVNDSKSSKETSVVIGVVYRHPSSSYKTFCAKVCKIIDDLNRKNVKFVIMGDINVNYCNYNIVGTVTNYFNDVQSAGCLSFVNKPTRICKRGTRWETSCPDHMYSNFNPENVSTYIIESGISDHYSCLMKIRGIRTRKTADVKIFRRKSRLSEREIFDFNNDLKNVFSSESNYHKQKNVHDKAAYVVNTYQNLMDKYMPLRKLSRKETSFFLKPWLNTKGIRTSIQRRNILLGRSKRLKSSMAYEEYKKYDKILLKVKNASFNNHISSEVSENIDNKRKLWQTFNKISKRKKSKKPDITHLVDEEGKKINDPKEIANTLNLHFNQIGEKWRTK